MSIERTSVTTADDLIADLQRVAERVGAPVAATDYREHGNHSVSSFYDEFGSWDTAKEVAGVDGDRSHPSKIPREELLDDIRRVNERVEGVPTKEEYEAEGTYSISTVYSRFGSWTEARKAAGIEGTPAAHNHISREKLLDGLQTFAEERDETPTRVQMNNDGPYSGSAYRREFGSWNEALQAAGLPVNQPTDAEMTTIDCKWCGESMERERAQIRDQRNVFCSRYCKAQFQQSDEWGGADHPLSDRVEVDCAWCGETLRRKPSVVDRRERVFCDYDCMGAWRARNRTGEDSPRWRGGARNYYGPNWRRQRQRRREKDGYQCQRCGLTDEECKERFGKELSVHHRRPVRAFERPDGPPDFEAMNAVENLVTLCMECHRRIESWPVQPDTT